MITKSGNSCYYTMRSSIILGGGCFWCLEAVFLNLKGVLKVKSGYSGGHVKNPGYREVCYGKTGHAEVLQVDYDPELIDQETILEVFFTFHDPTTLNRQGNDVGTQYRSIIFYNTQEEKETFQRYIDGPVSEIWSDPIVTELKELEIFYPAEAYHDNYYNLNKGQGYCQFVISPKVNKLKQKYSTLLKTEDGTIE